MSYTPRRPASAGPRPTERARASPRRPQSAGVRKTRHWRRARPCSSKRRSCAAPIRRGRVVWRSWSARSSRKAAEGAASPRPSACARRASRLGAAPGDVLPDARRRVAGGEQPDEKGREKCCRRGWRRHFHGVASRRGRRRRSAGMAGGAGIVSRRSSAEGAGAPRPIVVSPSCFPPRSSR